MSFVCVFVLLLFYKNELATSNRIWIEQVEVWSSGHPTPCLEQLFLCYFKRWTILLVLHSGVIASRIKHVLRHLWDKGFLQSLLAWIEPFEKAVGRRAERARRLMNIAWHRKFSPIHSNLLYFCRAPAFMLSIFLIQSLNWCCIKYPKGLFLVAWQPYRAYDLLL